MKRYIISLVFLIIILFLTGTCKREYTHYEKPIDSQNVIVSRSNENGEATFDLSNNTFRIIVRNASTGERINGYDIRMVQKDSLISLFGYDTQGRYLHKIDGLVLDSKKGIISLIWDIIDCYILTGETIYSSGTINDQALIAALFGGTFINETETTLRQIVTTILEGEIIGSVDQIVSIVFAVPSAGSSVIIELVGTIAGLIETSAILQRVNDYLEAGYTENDPFIIRERVYTTGIVFGGACVSHFITIEPKYQLDNPLLNTGSVSLKLNDITTNAPISGARVSVIPGGTSPINFYSNQNGEVEIGNIKNGTHTITISHEDYLPATFNNIEVIFNQTNNLGVIKLASILPVVNTLSVNEINSNSAKAGGNILFSGPTQVSSRGVCWSLSQNPTIADNKTTDGNGTGQFPSTITGLSSNTKYYLRAYATNSAGTAYGQQISFNTNNSNNSGELDISFGQNGYVMLQGSEFEYINHELQQDGKILMVGSYFDNSNSHFAVKRYNNDGTNDLSFGNNGLVKVDFRKNAEGIALDMAMEVIEMSNGKILVAGAINLLWKKRSKNNILNRIPQTIKNTNYSKIAIALLNENGSLVSGFGINGTIIIDAGPGNVGPTSLVEQSDGKILIGLYYSMGSSSNLRRIVRVDGNGLIDESFGLNGYVYSSVLPIQSFQTFKLDDLVINQSNDIIIGGNSYDSDYVVARLNNNGELDHSFGQGGLTFPFEGQNGSQSYGYYTHIKLKSSGKIIIGGNRSSTVFHELVIAQLFKDGQIDNSFGNDGAIIIPPYRTTGMALQMDGKVYLDGNNQNSGESSLFRLSDNGLFDSSFGNNGSIDINILQSTEVFVYNIISQPNQKVIVGGAWENNSDWGYFLARYNP